MTRRNDRTLRADHDEPVRNRELWRVDTIDVDGSFTLSRQRGQGTVTIPADYAQAHLRLGYAATAHAHQGDTIDISYTLISLATSHRALYVGATRGRAANHLAVVTDEPDIGAARDILEYVLANDPADIPAIAVRRELEALGRQIQSEPVDPLTAAHQAVRDAMDVAQPYEVAVVAARGDVIDARSTLADLERQHGRAGIIGRRRLREPISEACQSLNRAHGRLDLAVEQAEPYRDAVDTATADRDALAAARRLEELRQSSVGRARSRPGPELGIGL